MRSQIWRKLDGGDTWEFNIVGIYGVDGGGVEQGQSAFFHYDYLNESHAVRQGRDRHGSSFASTTAPRPTPWRSASTRCSRTPSDETKTATERAFIKQLIDQIGNIGKILVSVVVRGVLHHAAGHGEHHGAVGA